MMGPGPCIIPRPGAFVNTRAEGGAAGRAKMSAGRPIRGLTSAGAGDIIAMN